MTRAGARPSATRLHRPARGPHPGGRCHQPRQAESASQEASTSSLRDARAVVRDRRLRRPGDDGPGPPGHPGRPPYLGPPVAGLVISTGTSASGILLTRWPRVWRRTRDRDPGPRRRATAGRGVLAATGSGAAPARPNDDLHDTTDFSGGLA
ncbi:hypothetical protein QJS66_18450 [Kocuria rhizophila]|nr:hypothetical protein QJS66_18450 [Kocuria rhizophila]